MISKSQYEMLDNANGISLANVVTSGKIFISPSAVLKCGRTNKSFKFSPQNDITPIELAWILQLLVTATGSYSYYIDVDEYVVTHKLERHFEVS